MSIKRVGIVAAALFVVANVASPRLEAMTVLTATFCSASSNPTGESTTCPDGLGATLKIDDIAGGDPNDYYVTLTLDSTLINKTQYTAITSVQFNISGANTGGSPDFGDYEAVPTVDTTGVDGGLLWSVYFDVINGGVQSCSQSGNGGATCSSTVSPYTDTGDMDVWKFYVDFDDSLGAFIGPSTGTNLRAGFLRKNGQISFLSPDGKTIGGNGGSGGSGGTGGGPGGVPDTGVPEPGTLMLLGTGFVVLANQARRRLRKADA